jgi:MAF protein
MILASASPRRHELLKEIVDDFTVVVADVEEDSEGPVGELAQRLALAKAERVARICADGIVLGADTVVALGGTAYGKPAGADGAAAMLRDLRSRTHCVYTAVAIIAGKRRLGATSASKVTMAALTDEAITAYVASGRPFDKAGAYAIQDDDVPTVAALDGCYCGVMGLPLWLTRRLLIEAGLESREPSLARCRDCPEKQSWHAHGVVADTTAEYVE